MSFSIASDYASGLFTSKVRLTETPFMQNVTEAGKVTPEMAYIRPKEKPKNNKSPLNIRELLKITITKVYLTSTFGQPFQKYRGLPFAHNHLFGKGNI